MPKTIEQKTESIPIELPESFWGVLSHTANIDYCIEQIRKHSDNGYVPVVLCRLAHCLNTMEKNHRLLPQEEAEERKLTNPRIEYFSLDELLKEKEDIKNGKYKIEENGHIIGPIEWYEEEKVYT